MLSLIWLIESSLSRDDLDFTAPWHWDWRTMSRAAADPGKMRGRDILILGDSQGKFGVMPPVVRDRSGRSAYSLAIHTGQTSTSYFLLRRALDAGATPGAIVLVATPHLLNRGPADNDRNWPELLTLAETIDLAQTRRDPSAFALDVLGRVFPSIMERHDLRAAIAAKFGGTSLSRRSERPWYLRNWNQNDGGQLLADLPAPPTDWAVFADRTYGPWQCDPTNASYLDRIFALARARHVPVYWLLAPVQPGIQQRLDANGYSAGYVRFIRSVQARFPEVLVLDGRSLGLGPDEFLDGIHNNRRGALRLSAAVAEVLKARVGAGPGGNWKVLEPVVAQASDQDVEDLYRTSQIVQARQAKARR